MPIRRSSTARTCFPPCLTCEGITGLRDGQSASSADIAASDTGTRGSRAPGNTQRDGMPGRNRRSPAARGITCVLALALVWPAAAKAGERPNTLSEYERRAGWELLFDGKTTKGWRNYRRETISDGWQVIDGALTRVKNGAGDIVTERTFLWFELRLEYRISRGGNSGVMFHVSEEAERPWQTGPEIQIQDNEHGHDPQKAGWLYQLYPAQVDATRPAGQWNELYVRIAPDLCEINMNGIRYARFQIGSDDWKRRVAKSKFAKYPEFGKPRRGHICLQDHGNEVAFRNIKIRELVPGQPVPDPSDGTLPLRAVPAFPRLKWAGWEPIDARGKSVPLRPIVLTHAGDGSGRIFVATQRGVIHVFRDTPQQPARKTSVFLDIRDRVIYRDNMNEEGFLGLAFHPRYSETGEFFVYYTTREAEHTSVISRFRVSRDDPDRADPASEEKLLVIKQPFWNHNGGTVAFGPDGYLYIGLGDGGSANDPYGNGQNLATLLGSILRIDVDHKQDQRNYAIPPDNPFVDRKDARPEIWAYGFRNVWRLAFDRSTGTLWAGDVGQNLWEEIDIVVKGGNYGWNLREGRHSFGPRGSGPRPDLIEPIWEYDHGVGKSITGGLVYRGQRLPQLQGKYLYADYVTGRIWALTYDAQHERVLRNERIPSPQFPIISFGEDEAGEAYFLTVTADGRGIYRFEPAE